VSIPAVATSVDDLRLLCRIIESGSLRAAAAEIGVDPSSVTRRLGALEQRLGVVLMVRSRVRSTPTDAGRRYYRDLKVLLEQLEALEDEVAGAASEPRGLLRVAAPSVFGARHVGPWLHELQLMAPRLAVDLVLSDRPVDMIEHGIDVAVRIGALADSSLTVTRLGTMRTVIVASPDYLARRGTPAGPEELASHELVLHAGPLQSEELVLDGPRGRVVKVHCRSRFGVSSILGVLEAVVAGAGFNAGPLWLFADAIARGQLVHILPRWRPPTGRLQALVLPARYRPAKIAAALALLRARAPRLPGISR
jgi:LysR family transcriptional regulator, regulator for bpeEF and oprC